MVRRWRYGENIPTPFMPGERALVRAPVLKGEDVVLQTNEEAVVLSIKEGTYQHEMVACGPLEFWMASIPSWKLKLERGDGEKVTVHMPADDRTLRRRPRLYRLLAQGLGGRVPRQ